MNIFQRLINRAFINTDDEDSFLTWIRSGIKTKSGGLLLLEYKNLAYSCIVAIASDVAKYEPQIYNIGKDKPLADHPFLRVLHQPNPSMSQYDFMEATATYMELTGELFWYFALGQVTKQPKEMYLLRPDLMKVVIGDGGKVIGYTYKNSDGTDMPLALNEVYHGKNFDPTNPYRGYGTTKAIQLYLDIEDGVSNFQYNFLQNQATPSGVVSFNGTIGKDAFEKVKAEWKEKYGGLDNSGKTLFVRRSETTFTKIGLSIADLQLGDLKRLSKEDVLEGYRVPEAILGKTDSSGLGRSNIEAVEYIFAKRTIEPKLVKYDDAIRTILKNWYGQVVYVGHVSQVPEDKQFKLEERTVSVGRWKTVNEVRAEDGMLPIDGGDQLYVPFSSSPINNPADKTFGKAFLKTKSKPLMVTTTKAAVEHKHEFSTKGVDPFFVALNKLDAATEKKYLKGLKKLLTTQHNKVVQIIESRYKDVVSDGVNWELTFTEEDLTLNLLQLLFAAFLEAGSMSVDLLGVPDVQFVLQQATRDAIFSSTDRLMKSFNEETALKIQKQMAAGLAENEDVIQLKKRIESIYDEAKGYRAERIANTESHKAVNEAVAEGYKQSGVKKMRWVANPSACEFCKAMDGKEVTIGQPFVVNGTSVEGTDGGSYINDYTDVRYADLHPNCQCYLEAIK